MNNKVNKTTKRTAPLWGGFIIDAEAKAKLDVTFTKIFAEKYKRENKKF